MSNRSSSVLAGAALAAGLVLAARSVSATVESIQLSVRPHGPFDGSALLSVSGGRVHGARIPVIAGLTHTFTIKGNLVDLCDRVELDGPGVRNQTLPKSRIRAANVGGKGQIVFQIDGSDIHASGDFTVKIRYLVETSGFDRVDFHVVRRAAIRSVEWVGPRLPTVTAIPGGERSQLEIGVPYQLRANGTGFGPTQVGAGVNSGIFQQTVSAVQVTPTAVTLSFTPSHPARFLTTSIFTVPLSDSAVSSVPGGWGAYVLYRLDPASLPTNGALTDLAEVVVGNPGSTTVPPPPRIGAGGGTAPPPLPDLAPQLLGAFTSGADFSLTDLSTFRLCPTSPSDDPRTTVIPDLRVRVTNLGTAATAVPFTVAVTRNGAPVTTFTVPAPLAPGASTLLTIPRPENRVCATRDLTNPAVCRRCGPGVVVQWNDRGISVKVDAAGTATGAVTESNESNNVVTIP